MSIINNIKYSFTGIFNFISKNHNIHDNGFITKAVSEAINKE